MRFYSIYEVQHCRPETFGPHVHGVHEFVYCVEGNGEAEIGGRKDAFRTGNFYITHAGTEHTEWDNDPCRIIYFFFDAPREKTPAGTFMDYDGAMLSAVKKLLRESRGSYEEKGEMQLCLLRQILIHARRAAAGNTERDFSAIVQFINENLEQEICFRQLAEKQNYSYDRFRHLFRESVGVSPHQYLLCARIEKAKFLMELGGGASLTDIAMACGFTSLSQFANIFRAKTGTSPSEYRNRTVL